MIEETDRQLPLSGFRALDLTDEKGLECGKVLADMGMDVIQIEPPGGSSARNIGPFYKETPHPEKSLFWFAFNLNKRGITLDITRADGRNIFLSLVKGADIIIESFPVGFMEDLGLSYEALCRVNPKIIMASISGFGQTGPYKDFKAPDIVCMASGGEMNLIGYPDRAPLVIGFPQAYLHASVETANACLAALLHREMTGEGQYIDTSAQECVAWLGFYNQNMWDLQKKNIKREGARREMAAGRSLRFLYPSKDGFVSFLPTGGKTRAPAMRTLVDWMDREGMADDFIRQFDWETFVPHNMVEELNVKLERCFERFFGSKTNAELFDEAYKNGYFLAPVNSVEDIAKSPQLAHRKFWVEVEHPELNTTLTYPGVSYRVDGNPYRVRRRAPLIGEHNRDIFQRELGLSHDDLITLKSRGMI